MAMTELTRRGLDTVWHPITQAQQLEKQPPLLITEAHGCTLVDQHGNEYLDAIAGVWCVNVGYGREELAKVAYDQMNKLGYLSPGMVAEPTVRLASKLLEHTQMTGHVYFTSSGSESNEAAFKIVWQYHQQSGEPRGYLRQKIISRYRAYHGNTLAAISATGQAERKIGYAMQIPNIRHVNPPYVYRRRDGMTPEEHAEELAHELEQTIIYEGQETVAAFILEPMISGGGVLIPPDNYLPRVREVCDKYGILIIFDEVVAGFGRTGTMFGHQHWSARPDIVTCAKGIASGYQPLGAVIVDDRIYNAFKSEDVDLMHYRHINTYGGHPVATAVAHRNIEIIERENLCQNSADMGEYFLGKLSGLLDHPLVGDIRGKGLLTGIELVADKATKAAPDPAILNRVIAGCKRQGVIIGKNGNTVPGLANVLVISPPLTLNRDQADRIADAVITSVHAL